MTDTAARRDDRREATQSRQTPRVRVYRGPTHQWVVMARYDLTQPQAEVYAAHHAGTVPDLDVTGVSDLVCYRCELEWAEAPTLCTG